MDGAGAGPNRWARKASGWGLLAAGIAGCVLPVIPGIPLAIAGLVILARDYVWARRTLGHARRRVIRMRQQARAKRAGKVVMTRNGGAEEV